VAQQDKLVGRELNLPESGAHRQTGERQVFVAEYLSRIHRKPSFNDRRESTIGKRVADRCKETPCQKRIPRGETFAGGRGDNGGLSKEARELRVTTTVHSG